jgi:hypothetical protein
LTGPGSTVAGSVGLLLDNSVDTPDSASALIGPALISGYQTGIKAVQTTSASDGRKNRVWAFGTVLNNNGTDVLIGQDSTLEGGWSTTVTPGKIELQGNGLVDPRTFNYPRSGDETYQLNPGNSATPIFAPDNADQFVAGSIKLGGSTAYNVTITGQTASSTYKDFESPQNYPNQLVPYIAQPPYSIGLNPNTGVFRIVPGSLNAPAASLNGWTSSTVTQDAGNNGLLSIDATGGGGLDALYYIDGHLNPTNSLLYILDPVDISGATYIDLELKLDAGNTAEAIGFALIDARGNPVLWPLPLESPPLSSTAFTTFHLNMLTPSIPVPIGPDPGTFDLTNVTGFLLFGENGLLDLDGTDVDLRMSLDAIKLTSRANSQLASSGSIDLAGATLTGDIRTGFAPTNGQQFTIVNNTHASNPVTGTFAGATQGSTVTLDGVTFTINYSGGTGNDVVLTKVSASSTTVTGRRLFYNNSIWDNPGYGFTNASAIAGDKSAYVPTGANTTTFANMSSYTKGINGIMVELTGTHGTITASDFTFRMSPQFTFFNNSPGTWAAAPAPTSVTLVPNTPSSGTDRYEIIWADGAITERYLYVLVEGNDSFGGSNTNTGLAASDDFFFGSMVADVGTPEFYPSVNATDQLQVRGNQGVLAPPTGVLNDFDFNRDALVDASDQLIARANQGSMGWLALTAGPFGPEDGGGGGAGGGIASALAGAGSGGGKSGDWVAARLESAECDSGPSAAAVAQLMEGDSPDAGGSDGADDDADDDGDDSLLDDLG